MKTMTNLLLFMMCIGVSAYAQDVEKAEPKGKAIVQVFGNFHTGFGAESDNRGFELDRSYFGYEYNFGNGLSTKAVMDIGRSSDVSDYHRIVYIKNAMIFWKKERITLNGGLISTTQFNFQEKFWGYRYIIKSFQDEYKFGNSADLGISIAYNFADWGYADAIIVNGEGYKKIQINDGLNYGIGITLTPVKGFHIRVYGGVNERVEDGKKDAINLATFAGYKHKKFMIGVEYNQVWNSSYVRNDVKNGYFVYTSVNLSKITDLYARFDTVNSKNDSNIVKKEIAAILGAQFKLGKYVKIAPNFIMTTLKTNGATYRYYAYVNCYFGF